MPTYTSTGVHTSSASEISLQSSLPGSMTYSCLQHQHGAQIKNRNEDQVRNNEPWQVIQDCRD